jgi:hypothetical protein
MAVRWFLGSILHLFIPSPEPFPLFFFSLFPIFSLSIRFSFLTSPAWARKPSSKHSHMQLAEANDEGYSIHGIDAQYKANVLFTIFIAIIYITLSTLVLQKE